MQAPSNFHIKAGFLEEKQIHINWNWELEKTQRNLF